MSRSPLVLQSVDLPHEGLQWIQAITIAINTTPHTHNWTLCKDNKRQQRENRTLIPCHKIWQSINNILQ
jgi:hypothetical protein